MALSSTFALKCLGYAQSGAVDASTLISSLTFATPGKIPAAAGIPAGTQLLIIQPQTQAARWRDDSTAPTAAVGYPLAVGAELRYDANGFASLAFISQVAGCILNVLAYG